MHLARTLIILVLALALAAVPALAQPPLNGTWNSTDLGGDVDVGRYTEGYDTANAAAAPGTVLNAMSWDGMNLGQQWRYTCGVVQVNPFLISDTVNASGTGSRTYQKNFVGGEIWLSGSGPWGGGDAFYSGPILSYTEYETIQYVAWERTHAVTNVAAIAQLDGYNDACLSFTVGNGVEIGSTDFGMMLPGDYPEALDAGCSPGAPNAAWWNMMTLSLYIDACAVPQEQTSWGSLKSMYR